jgi:hypothetical protein
MKSFHTEPYTLEELTILYAKGWDAGDECTVLGNYSKLVKQEGKYVLFYWEEDDELMSGGFYEEWPSDVFENINDVPTI